MGPEQGGECGEVRPLRVTCLLFGRIWVSQCECGCASFSWDGTPSSFCLFALCPCLGENDGKHYALRTPKTEASTSTLGTDGGLSTCPRWVGCSPSHWVGDCEATQGVQFRLSEWAGDQRLGACSDSLVLPFGGDGGGFLLLGGGPRVAPCHRDIILRRKVGWREPGRLNPEKCFPERIGCL